MNIIVLIALKLGLEKITAYLQWSKNRVCKIGTNIEKIVIVYSIQISDSNSVYTQIQQLVYTQIQQLDYSQFIAILFTDKQHVQSI